MFCRTHHLSPLQFPNLLSDFGGQLGLWMGVSVITIMEVFILIAELLISLLGSCMRCPGARAPGVAHRGATDEVGVASDRAAPALVRNGKGSMPFIDEAPPRKARYVDVVRSFQ